MNLIQGHRNIFSGVGGELSKNVGHHGWLVTKKNKKNKKKNWLKCPKAVPKNEIWTKIYMVQNLILRILFLKILLQASNTFIFIHKFQWTSSEFFLLLFSSRKSQSQQKLAKKGHSFHSTISLKRPHSFYKPQLTWNNMLPQHSQSPF